MNISASCEIALQIAAMVIVPSPLVGEGIFICPAGSDG